MSATRVFVPDSFGFPTPEDDRFRDGQWPASWIAPHNGDPPNDSRPMATLYRLKFSQSDNATVRWHVTADQRYELFLDGERIGHGPERGDLAHWFFESYAVDIAPGKHVLVARVWFLPLDVGVAPVAQISIRPGFLLAADAPFTEIFSTGIAKWEAKILRGYQPLSSPNFGGSALAGGATRVVAADVPDGWRTGEGGDDWQTAPKSEAARNRVIQWGEYSGTHRLQPATLPAQRDEERALGNVRHVDLPPNADTQNFPVHAENHRESEVADWQSVFTGGNGVTVPANTHRRVIVDLENYYCAFPDVTFSGGSDAQIRLHWAESLYEGDENHPSRKGNRDVIHNKRFIGRGDLFIADGGAHRTLDTAWWMCGRYLEVLVETKNEPLTITAIRLRETRYPFGDAPQVTLSEPRFNDVVPLMWRTLQMCAHETYMDCPYYEQLQYTGDTRLEVLVTYLAGHDNRLPRKAIQLFGASQTFAGLTQARYPCRHEQIIPQFSLFWVAMLHDFALWQNDPDFVKAHLPRARAILEIFLSRISANELLDLPEGWNWVDWVPDWPNGSPPGDRRSSGINQWQLIYVLGLAAELERSHGDDRIADRYETHRHGLATAARQTFWNDDRGLFADTPEKNRYSEHAQCYALLSGLLGEVERHRIGESLLSASDLARATIYFQHYLFESFQQIGQAPEILNRLDLWYGLKENGLKTAIESPEPTRSDCHAWSAHPIYHAIASLIGVRPDGFGFERVKIRPQLGELTEANTRIPHPGGGWIEVNLKRDGETLSADITLPENVSGELLWNSHTRVLRAGQQTKTRLE